MNDFENRTKNRCIGIWNRIIAMVMTLLLVFSVMPTETFAESKKAKAKSALQGLLHSANGLNRVTGWSNWCWNRQESECWYIKIDINKDGITEMVVTPDEGYHVYIVAYVKGSLKTVGHGFSGYEKYYPSRKLYLSVTGHDDGTTKRYYRFNGKSMTEVCSFSKNENTDRAPSYTIAGKPVSKKKYKAYVKKLVGNAKAANVSWKEFRPAE